MALVAAVAGVGEFRVSGFEFRFGGRALGAVVGDGDVGPGDPATWTSGTTGYVGNTGVGKLTVNSGGVLLSRNGHIGYQSGASGTVTVDGSGSKWNSLYIYVGDMGMGSLNIANGGQVYSSTTAWLGYYGCGTGVVTIDGSGSNWTCNGTVYVGFDGAGSFNIVNGGAAIVGGVTYLGYGGNSTGSIGFGANGGTYTTRTFYGAPGQVGGTGTICARGLVSDIELLFDSTHNVNQAMNWSGVGQNVTLQLDLTGTSGAVGDIGVGYRGAGTLTIRDGTAVQCANGQLGFNSSATGMATVDGSGSAWTCSGSLTIGNSGTGMLAITNGGKVSDSFGYVGYQPGSMGTIAVEGSGSGWTCSQMLYLGNSGMGTLTIANGANCNFVWGCCLGYKTGSSGEATVDGTGSSLTCGGIFNVGSAGTGVLNITNGGLVAVTKTTTVSPGSMINFGANGGTLSTGSFSGLPAQVTGNGTIIEYGQIADGDLIFDGTTGPFHTTDWAEMGQNVTCRLDLSGAAGTLGELGVGFQGMGTLKVRDGVTIKTDTGYIGYGSGTGGVATIDGTGSTWACGSKLYVGNSATGALTITNGGKVSSSYGYVGYNTSSAGTVAIDGSGSNWTLATDLYVGNAGTGTLTITGGAKVSNVNSYLGYNNGAAGTVTVGGSGSGWTCSGTLNVGNSGMGALTITGGGSVTSNSAYIANNAGATGSVVVDGSGSTWTSGRTLTIGNYGTGSLMISNGGYVSSGVGIVSSYSNSAGNVAVDGTGSAWICSGQLTNNGTLAITNGGTVSSNGGNVGYPAAGALMMVDGSGSTWTCDGSATIGSYCVATLIVSGGGKVYSTYRILIGNKGSDAGGVVRVDGSGSTCTCLDTLYVGGSCPGTLTITNGGQVSDGTGNLGNNAAGIVAVDGGGSTWTNNGRLYVGTGSDASKLTICNGGVVTATQVTSRYLSLITINVGDQSRLSTGALSVSDGTLRMKCVPGLAAGTYTPISASSWHGAMTALGGKWNTTTHTFMVSAAANGAAGAAIGIDTSLAQRVTITGGTANRSVWLGFQGTTASASLTVTGARLTEGEMAGLQGVVGAAPVLAGWDFTTNGYTAGVPVAVSMEVGAGYSTDALTVWHWDGGAWTSFAASDLSYDGEYANFTVTGFSGYAVVGPAPVPEPGALSVVGLGLAGLLVRRRRRRRPNCECRMTNDEANSNEARCE